MKRLLASQSRIAQAIQGPAGNVITSEAMPSGAGISKAIIKGAAIKAPNTSAIIDSWASDLNIMILRFVFR